jgi:hypothetical protein
MSTWDAYPADYRAKENKVITASVQAGECFSLVGLSGSGKSNLLGFLARRLVRLDSGLNFILIDSNRLFGSHPQDFWRLVRRALAMEDPETSVMVGDQNELALLESAIRQKLKVEPAICLLVDRFDGLKSQMALSSDMDSIYGNLRALRDEYKYDLTFVIAARYPIESSNELSELFYANTYWLGPLQMSDALWSIAHYMQRKNIRLDIATSQKLVEISWGYPAFLRAVCEAYAAGSSPELQALSSHPIVQRRLAEFWKDQPSEQDLANSGLAGHPFLVNRQVAPQVVQELDTSILTAKEHLLLQYLKLHPGQVCEKDDLIRAVWPEDKLFERGVRDDSLAQLVRRLRKKIETDASLPQSITTIPGRGYRFNNEA